LAYHVSFTGAIEGSRCIICEISEATPGCVSQAERENLSSAMYLPRRWMVLPLQMYGLGR